MFKKINKLIEKNINNETEDYVVFLEIEKEYKKTQPKEIQKNLKIHDYENRELVIKGSTAAWKSEDSLLKNQIKKNF